MAEGWDGLKGDEEVDMMVFDKDDDVHDDHDEDDEDEDES